MPYMLSQSLPKDADLSNPAVMPYLLRLWDQPQLTTYSLIESSPYRPQKAPIAEGIQASLHTFSRLSVSHQPMVELEPKTLRNPLLIQQLILELEDLHQYLAMPVISKSVSIPE